MVQYHQTAFLLLNLPDDSRRHSILHILIAHKAHLAREQVKYLDATVSFSCRNVLVIVVEAHAIGGHIDGTKSHLGLHAELRALRVLVTVQTKSQSPFSAV